MEYMDKTDSYLVGILPEYNFRFLLADCSNSVREVIQRHEMENSSATLVGKTMIAAFFLAGLVKEETMISIQLEGEGDVERVMAYSERGYFVLLAGAECRSYTNLLLN